MQGDIWSKAFCHVTKPNKILSQYDFALHLTMKIPLDWYKEVRWGLSCSQMAFDVLQLEIMMDGGAARWSSADRCLFFSLVTWIAIYGHCSCTVCMCVFVFMYSFDCRITFKTSLVTHSPYFRAVCLTICTKQMKDKFFERHLIEIQT